MKRRQNILQAILAYLLRWLGPPPGRRVMFAWTVEHPTPKPKECCIMLELSLTNEEQVVVRLHPLTATGKPAKLDGKPTWTVNSGPVTLVPGSDGLSCAIVSADDDLSDAVVQVDADADLGDGIEAIADTILVHTYHANATSLGLTADAPTPKE